MFFVIQDFFFWHLCTPLIWQSLTSMFFCSSLHWIVFHFILPTRGLYIQTRPNFTEWCGIHSRPTPFPGENKHECACYRRNKTSNKTSSYLSWIWVSWSAERYINLPNSVRLKWERCVCVPAQEKNSTLEEKIKTKSCICSRSKLISFLIFHHNHYKLVPNLNLIWWS